MFNRSPTAIGFVAPIAAAAATAGAVAVTPTGIAAAIAGGTVLLALRRPDPEPASDHLLRRHLAVCRRRGGHAHVLVAAGAAPARALQSELRISDSVVCQEHRGRTVLVAVVDADEDGLARDRVTARLRGARDGELHAGWATFPDEGYTLDALVEIATARTAPVGAGGRTHRIGGRP